MAEVAPVYGRDRILMFRRYDQRTQEGAAKLALQTQHSWKFEAKSDSTETKDGNINSPATAVATLDIEAIASNDPVNKMLEQAVKDGAKLEVWDINLAAPQEDGNKFEARYGQGYMQDWETPAEVGKLTELKTTMNIDQLPQDGFATLTTEQQNEIQYAFQDTVKATDGGEEAGK